MGCRRMAVAVVLMVVASANAAPRSGPESFRATAMVETPGGAKATAPLLIVVERTTSADEAEGLVRAFTTGGEPALRQALGGLSPTGSVRIGNAGSIVARITLERPTDKGRLLTLVTDQPILFLGAGLPNAKAKQGYGFAVLDIEIDAEGNGSGTLSPAAKVKVANGAFVVDEYATEVVRLTDVRRAR